MITDAQTGENIFRGDVTFQDLSHFNWQTEGYKNYQPDSAAIAYLKQHLAAYRIRVYLGTWCEDSHLLIPQLQKILEEAGYPLQEVKMIAVDRQKTSPEELEKQDHIQFVPTIILSRDGKEKGRVVEGAYPNLEAALVKIIKP